MIPIIQAVEMNKQMPQQQAQNLTNLMKYFEDTMAQSVDDLINRLELDLDLFAERTTYRPEVTRDIERCILNRVESCASEKLALSRCRFITNSRVGLEGRKKLLLC